MIDILAANGKRRTTSALVAVAVAWAESAQLLAGCTHTPAAGKAYGLTVELISPYNHKLTIVTTVTPNKPFEITKRKDGIKSTISGVLRAPVDGKFPLELTVCEWESETSCASSTTELSLELGKTWSGGAWVSLYFGRTVTLSKLEGEEMQIN